MVPPYCRVFLKLRVSTGRWSRRVLEYALASFGRSLSQCSLPQTRGKVSRDVSVETDEP